MAAMKAQDKGVLEALRAAIRPFTSAIIRERTGYSHSEEEETKKIRRLVKQRGSQQHLQGTEKG
jgi:uncharacterized protein YqeY